MKLKYGIVLLLLAIIFSSVQAQKTKAEFLRGVVSNKYKYQATMIYRPRLQFSCMLVVFAASGAAISSSI